VRGSLLAPVWAHRDAEMQVNGQKVKFQLDSGASVNLINIQHISKEEIRPTLKTLVMWNNSEVKPVGEAKVMLCNKKNNKLYRVNFVVVEEDLKPLLGAKAVQNMG
jgi:hypothetical protein